MPKHEQREAEMDDLCDAGYRSPGYEAGQHASSDRAKHVATLAGERGELPATSTWLPLIELGRPAIEAPTQLDPASQLWASTQTDLTQLDPPYLSSQPDALTQLELSSTTISPTQPDPGSALYADRAQCFHPEAPGSPVAAAGSPVSLARDEDAACGDPQLRSEASRAAKQVGCDDATTRGPVTPAAAGGPSEDSMVRMLATRTLVLPSHHEPHPTNVSVAAGVGAPCAEKAWEAETNHPVERRRRRAEGQSPAFPAQVAVSNPGEVTARSGDGAREHGGDARHGKRHRGEQSAQDERASQRTRAAPIARDAHTGAPMTALDAFSQLSSTTANSMRAGAEAHATAGAGTDQRQPRNRQEAGTSGHTDTSACAPSHRPNPGGRRRQGAGAVGSGGGGDEGSEGSESDAERRSGRGGSGGGDGGGNGRAAAGAEGEASDLYASIGLSQSQWRRLWRIIAVETLKHDEFKVGPPYWLAAARRHPVLLMPCALLKFAHQALFHAAAPAPGAPAAHCA